MNHKYLEIHQLGKSFDTPLGPTHVVEGFDLTLREGEFVSIIGHSGCGKSTVLSMVAGLTESSQGAIILAGKEVVDAGPDRGVVFQAPCLLAWLSALENVRLGVDQVYP
ncbi:MAG: Bicarbonate transport ATP-binding protein CmpD, partial [Pseudomonadota bacterium]